MMSVTCSCGKHYQVPEQLAGKRLKCKQCGGPIEVPSDPPALADDDVLIADEVEEAEDIISGGVAVAPLAAGPMTPVLTSSADAGLGSSLGAYFKDCARSLIFFAEPHNFAPFVIVAILAMIKPWFVYAACIGGICMIILQGWILSFLFNTLLNAAGGSRELPELNLLEGPVDTIIIPMFKYLASWVVVLWPAIAYTLFVSGVDDILSLDDTVGILLIAGGVALWPMSLLLIALGGVSSFARPDLILITLVRTFVPYLFTCIFSGLATVLFWFALAGAEFTPGAEKHPIAMVCLFELASLYAWVVVMRFIGLYYHHFKQRFAWSWG